MTTTTDPVHLPPQRFELAKPIGWQALGWLALGAVGLLAVGLKFAAVSVAKGPQRGRDGWGSGFVGGIGAVAVMAVARAVVLLRRPVRAIVDGDGVSVEGYVSRKRFAWRDVARVERDDDQSEVFGSGKVSILTLRDERGRALARLTDDFADFDALAHQLQARSSAARGAATFDPSAERQRLLAKQLRTARWRTAFLSLIALLGLVAAGWGAYEAYLARQLRADGVDALAKVERHYLRSVTGWVDVSFTDASGQRHTRSTSMETDAWEALRGQETVPVRYARSNPSNNRIAGESDIGSPWTILLIGLGMATVFAIFPVMYLLGIADIKTKEGRLKLVRLGEVDEPEPAPAPAPAPASAPAPAPPPPPRPQLPASDSPTVARVSAPLGLVGTPPSGVIAIGWLNVVFGIVGMLYNGGRATFLVVMRDQILTVGDRFMFIEWAPWRVAAMVADFVLAALLLVSGVGVVRLRRWGRRLALLAASGQVLSSLGWLAWLVYDASTSMPLVAEEDKRNATAMIFGASCAGLVGMIYPVVVLIALGRRGAREAFERRDTGYTHPP